MSYADLVFKNMCSDILENGTDTRGEAVRPHWPDGTAAYTIKKFGICNRYDLQREFPALTRTSAALRRFAEKAVIPLGQASMAHHLLPCRTRCGRY